METVLTERTDTTGTIFVVPPKAKYWVVWDVEGPRKNPKFDLAHFILEEHRGEIDKKLGLVSLDDKDLSYIDAVLTNFDKYDDARWIHDRGMGGLEFRHSTGTTPLVSLILCALMDWDDDYLSEFVEKHTLDTPGIEKINRLMRRAEARQVFISSSYPRQCLRNAERNGLSFADVYCLGNQLSAEERGRVLELADEVKRRSPLGLWRKHKDELKGFLDSYLANTWELFKEYDKGEKCDEKEVEKLLEQQEGIFTRVKNTELRGSLYALLYRQEGMMGGHRKRKALEKVEGPAIYIGDSIVDADPLEAADIGIVINCTDKHCLHATDIAIAALSWEFVEPLMDALVTGELRKEDISQEAVERYIAGEHRPYVKVFARSYIEGNFDEVKNACGKTKKAVKGAYDEWSENPAAYNTVWKSAAFGRMPRVFS